MIGLSERRPGSPTVVFLHGAGIASWMWRRQLAALPGLDAVALDLPGHGRSAAVPWRSVPDAADRVADWIGSQATGGRAHLVGLSLGGVVGLELAARYPALLDRMVVSGALGTGLPGAEWLGAFMEATMPLARMGWLLRLSGRILGLSPADQAALAEDVRRIQPGLVRQAIRDVAAFRVSSVLFASPVPALVVAGTREARAIKRTVTQVARDWPTAVGRLVPRASHVWNWQFPDRFDAMLRDWLLERRVPAFLVAP